MGQSVRVRVKDGLSDSAVIGHGKAMLRDALSGVNEGIRVGGHLIKTVLLADDHVTLASSIKGLQLMMDKIQETTEEYGMKINVKKNKVMKTSKMPRV